MKSNSLPRESLGGLTPYDLVHGKSVFEVDYSLPNGETTNGEEDKNNRLCGNQGHLPTNGEPGTGETTDFSRNLENLVGDPPITTFSIRKDQVKDFVGRKILLKALKRCDGF